MSKPIGGARKSIKNQEGQGMLDIDENSSVEDDMFENVKTDEDMDHEMEEEEGGSAFEEEIDPDESDQQEQAVIPKSQTPFLSDKDTPESYGELIGFMEKFIEDQKAENDAFRKRLVTVGRLFPSSQLCHECGYRFSGTKDLSVREWTCPSCGRTHDRDVNAALNIRDEGMRLALSA